MTDPRRTSRWQTESRRWLTTTQPTHCAICYQPLNPDAAPRTPDATEVDHVMSIAEGCDPYDVSNWQATHKRCNAAKGAGQATRPPLHTTRDW